MKNVVGKTALLLFIAFLNIRTASASDHQCYVGVNNDCFDKTVISIIKESNVSQLDAINQAFNSLDQELKTMCMTHEVLNQYYRETGKLVNGLFWSVSDDNTFKIIGRSFPQKGTGPMIKELRSNDECKYQSFCAVYCGNLIPWQAQQ